MIYGQDWISLWMPLERDIHTKWIEKLSNALLFHKSCYVMEHIVHSAHQCNGVSSGPSSTSLPNCASVYSCIILTIHSSINR